MELTPYQRYYQKNREALLLKQKEKYDPDAKKEYYTAHAKEIKEKMKLLYVRRKEEQHKKALEKCLETADDPLKTTIRQLLLNDYKTMKPSAIRAIESLSQRK